MGLKWLMDRLFFLWSDVAFPIWFRTMPSMFSSNNSTLDNFVICSLNVKGLSNADKRRETFNWLRNKNVLFIYYKKFTVLRKRKISG